MHLTLPFVSVAGEARELTYGEVYVTDKAWSRWQEAVTALGGPHKVLSTYGRMYMDVEAALAGADERTKEALTLRKADLTLMQAEQPRDEAAGSAALTATTLDPVRALLGVDKAGRGLQVERAAAYTAVSAVAQWIGVISHSDPFGTAALQELGARLSHLQEMLKADPWVHRTLTERCDFVIVSCQLAKRAEERRVSVAAAAGETGAGGGGAISKQGPGKVPKHFQSRVHAALTSMPYAELKRDALQRISRGEGPERGVQAELVDDELTAPGSIARVSWPGLNGRAGGLQLTVDKVTLPENLQGLELPEVLTATSGGDWSALDLGACYRKARARLRARDVAVAEKGRAYTSYEDVMQALEVHASVDKVVVTYGARGHEGIGGELHQWKPCARLSDCRVDGRSRRNKRPREGGAEQEGGSAKPPKETPGVALAAGEPDAEPDAEEEADVAEGPRRGGGGAGEALAGEAAEGGSVAAHATGAKGGRGLAGRGRGKGASG
ncbi:MAG: hypothetical protein SGPRY_001692 [Prymnesium sp.]